MEPKKKIVYLIYGLGCKSIFGNDSEDFSRRETFFKALTKNTADVNIRCNNYIHALSAVFRRLIDKPLDINDPFVSGIRDEILIHLIRDKASILILGHSYGGSVAARLGEYFNETFNNAIYRGT